MYKELTVFLKNGNTLKFENVTSFFINNTEKIVSFFYVSMSTGMKKYAILFLNNIAMFSRESEL